MSQDSEPYTNKGHYRTWFYFSVKGVPINHTLTFVIRNMNNQGALYRAGLKPVYRVMPKASKKWKRIPGNVDFGKGEEGYQVTFSHTFTEDATQEETYYFAFSYPYSLEESLKASQRMLKKYQDSETIYFHKEILALSLENRPMELLTITGKDEKIMTERELLIESLFPYHDGENEIRPFITNKPTVFLTARVHPGETPASYVLNGILNFILNEKSEQAKILRDRFVFKVIPILNPDGVYRGYYRHDTKN